MSVKLNFFHYHVNFVSENMGDISEEHGERFQQTIYIYQLWKGDIKRNRTVT